MKLIAADEIAPVLTRPLMYLIEKVISIDRLVRRIGTL